MLQELQSPVDLTLPANEHEALLHERLVSRIVHSPAFVRSPRLSDFLLYICKETKEGRRKEISEHTIGVAVFGRSEDYDPTIDSIVRSHATRLRQRLREFFETEGEHEPILLSIPKGSYVPRFERHHFPVLSNPTLVAISEPPRQVEDVSTKDAQEFLSFPKHVGPFKAGDETLQKTIRRLQLLLAASITIIVLLGIAFWPFPLVTAAKSKHPLWSGFLDPRRGRIVIVESDSGLVMLEHLTGRPVPLDEYMSGKYMSDLTNNAASPELTAKLASKRYTPVVDTEISTHLTRLLNGSNDSVTLHYARDLRLDELKQGNALLMGSSESDPWVSLFEPSMNFHFRGDLANGNATIVNLHPNTGERSEYSMIDHDPEQTVYGLLAYRPNLDHIGDALIVEGLTVAGTETAADFLFNDSHLLPFLKSIARKDGTLPHFEVVLQSRSISGQSSKNEIVAYRIEND